MDDAILHVSIPVTDLEQARDFYEGVLGCRVGRVRHDWLDVWFFGMQVTLQQRPDEVAAAPDAGVRHFGVTLADYEVFSSLVDRIQDLGVSWTASSPSGATEELSGKIGGKVADPSGNVIEIKYYADLRNLVAVV